MSFHQVTHDGRGIDVHRHDGRGIDVHRGIARYMDVHVEPARAGELQILDARERAERDEGHIPGLARTPYHDIYEIPEGVDPGRPVARLCASGRRALHRVERPA